MKDELDRRTREFFDAEEGRTPLDYAECLIASGTSIRKLADALTKTLGFEVNRESLRRYLQSLDEENYAARMRAAQEHGASAFAESSIDILDDATPEEASLAAAKSRARQWIAEKWNAREFGRATGPAVVLNVGQLMLQALQAPPPLARATLTGPALTASALTTPALTPLAESALTRDALSVRIDAPDVSDAEIIGIEDSD